LLAKGGSLFGAGCISGAAKSAGNESLTISGFDGKAVAFAFDTSSSNSALAIKAAWATPV